MASTSSDFPPHSHEHMLSTALSIVEQAPPPSLREILSAYRSKGDGDRDMLLAMLNAKAAEDQRIASVASLQRTLLDAYQNPQQAPNSTYHQPTPQPPHLCDRKSRHQYHHHHHHMPVRSRSPPRVHHYNAHHVRDSYMEHSSRKRHRSSHSPPPPHIYDMRPGSQHGSQHDHLPPSPYSSSGRSDSAECSPHSRSTMAIGSLLSSGPRTEGPRDDV